VSGSGKSWLAVRLGQVLGLPVYHLDRLHWRPGWQPTPKAEWRALQQELVAEPAWIIDGNYGSTLDLRLGACDTVIWLDLPTWVCLWGVVRRYLTYRRRTRPDLSPGCPERLKWEFLRYVAFFRRYGRPRILRSLGAISPTKQVVRLTSRRGMARWLGRIQRGVGAQYVKEA
jgi:adenylate kinase family enzyme